jgi:hypothetical protein
VGVAGKCCHRPGIVPICRPVPGNATGAVAGRVSESRNAAGSLSIEVASTAPESPEFPAISGSVPPRTWVPGRVVLAARVHEPGVPTRGPGKPAAKLEVPLIQRATGQEVARAASAAQTSRCHEVDHLLDPSPLLRRYAGIQIGELAAKARLTPLRHSVAPLSRVAFPVACSRLSGPPDACAGANPGLALRRETQSVRR